MQSLICRQCKASLNWDGVSELVKCEYCGTQYLMHPRRGSPSGQGVSVGLGEVSPIRTSRGRLTGTALAKCYVPKGWKVSTGDPEERSNRMVPLSLRAEFSSPDENAFITYTGMSAYDHLEPIPQNAPMQGQISHPNLVIGLAYRDAEAICDGMISQNTALANASVLSRTDVPDGKAAALIKKNVDEYTTLGIIDPGGNYSRKIYSVKDRNGSSWQKIIECVVTSGFLPVPQHEILMYQMLQQQRARSAGMLGMLRPGIAAMAGSMMAAQQQIQPPQPKLRWTVHYIVETSVKEGSDADAEKIHTKIRDTFETLPLFDAETEKVRQYLNMCAAQEQNAVNGALEQMNRDNMASWDRKQQIVSDTSAYTSGVMHQMFDSNAATMDRVNNLRSEQLREVNTYYTAADGGYGDPRVVEADIGWDHVYQNTEHPDIYAASTGEAPLEFGVDYEELKQTDGEY